MSTPDPVMKVQPVAEKVLSCSPSLNGDFAVIVFDINYPSLPTLFFYSVLVSVSVFMALPTVFHSINSPDNAPLSLGVCFQP